VPSAWRCTRDTCRNAASDARRSAARNRNRSGRFRSSAPVPGRVGIDRPDVAGTPSLSPDFRRPRRPVAERCRGAGRLFPRRRRREGQFNCALAEARDMYDRIKGFRDFYPRRWGPVGGRWMPSSPSRAATASADRHAGPGGDRDVRRQGGEEIVDELYSFEDKGGRQVALTPELTPTVARMAVAKQQELSKPIKVGLDPAVLALRGAPAGPLSGVLPDERRHLRLVRSGR